MVPDKIAERNSQVYFQSGWLLACNRHFNTFGSFVFILQWTFGRRLEETGRRRPRRTVQGRSMLIMYLAIVIGESRPHFIFSAFSSMRADFIWFVVLCDVLYDVYDPRQNSHLVLKNRFISCSLNVRFTTRKKVKDEDEEKKKIKKGDDCGSRIAGRHHCASFVKRIGEMLQSLQTFFDCRPGLEEALIIFSDERGKMNKTRNCRRLCKV